MSPANNKQSGITVVEALMTVAVLGLVLVLVMRFFSDFNAQKWEQDAVADVRSARDLVAEIVRKEVPRSIAANSTTSPIANRAIWSCPVGGPCRLTSDGRTEGIELVVECRSTRGMAVLAATSFQSVTSVAQNCSVCGAGTRPVLVLRQYASGVLARTIEIPEAKAAGGNPVRGVVGFGLCFNAPLYRENQGTDSAPVYVNKYDRWRVTLVPVYFRQPPDGKRAGGYASILTASPEDIMMAPPSQLGSKIMIIK